MEFKFIITYYFARYHTGELNENKTRKAIVYHSTISKAIDLIKIIDTEFICVKDIEFEELR